MILGAGLTGYAQNEAMLNFVGTQEPGVLSPIYASIPGTIGWTFQPLTDILVTALGAFDYDLPVGPVYIGLWDSAGDLLASSTMTSSSTLVNQSRYETIVPVTLTLDQTYYLGEFLPGGVLQAVAVNPSTSPYGYATMSPEIQLGNAAYENNSDFGFPSAFDGSTGSAITGPNFQFEPVPEPAAFGLVGISLLALLGTRRRMS